MSQQQIESWLNATERTINHLLHTITILTFQEYSAKRFKKLQKLKRSLCILNQQFLSTISVYR